MKKSRKSYELDYKRQIVGEYVSGKTSAEEIAKREGLVRGQIYKWRVQLDQYQREERIETIAQTEGVSIDQARRIRELEEELAATQQKLAQSVLEVDLLKNHCRSLCSRAYRVGTSTPSGCWLGPEGVPNDRGIHFHVLLSAQTLPPGPGAGGC